ncbi:DUF7537 family lipoprotein [Halapricum desulfuricans]|uniref:LppX_LprAFG lipoprotein n=1 Tax=Halapricum desulfuricans TaxID=2841257 RepID=A0A897N4M0_9EURY|nr:hypothetical protein [Halapricum desulfuricans]QSG06203.1 Uncharacterized protein HSR121_1869 [Halapricum desulfuricans]
MDRLLSPKTKQIVLVVLAVSLVALAGCTTGGDTTPTETPTGEELTDEPTDTPTDEPTDTPTDEPPESDIDPDELADSHATLLEDADSVTAGRRVVQRQAADGNTTVLSQQVQGYYDFEESTGLQASSRIQRGQFGSFTSSAQAYTAGNETFLRQNSSQIEEPQYAYDSEPYNESTPPTPVSFTGVGWGQLYESWSPSLQSQGETDFQGETVEQYRAEGEESLPYLSENVGASLGSLDEINATVLVTEDGLVTYTAIQVSGTGPNGGDVTSTYEFTVTDLNETTVEEPDWTGNVNTTG